MRATAVLITAGLLLALGAAPASARPATPTTGKATHARTAGFVLCNLGYCQPRIPIRPT